MLSPFELVQFDTEAAEPVRDRRGFCVPVGPGMGVGEPSLVVEKVGICLLLGWNKLPKALRSVPSGGVGSSHSAPESSACMTTVWDPLPLSFSALPSSPTSISCSAGFWESI